jgi:hypothetical protein
LLEGLVVVFGFQIVHAAGAQAIVEIFLQVAALLFVELNSGALTKQDRTHLALKFGLAARTIFLFVFTHTRGKIMNFLLQKTVPEYAQAKLLGRQLL